jgi:hypothetical protein
MLINLRNAMMAGKRWKNPYDIDGAIAWWDAEWNVGGGEHSSNPEIWKDLIGDGDLTLMSGLEWNDKFVWRPTANNLAYGFNTKKLGFVSAEIVFARGTSATWCTLACAGDLNQMDIRQGRDYAISMNSSWNRISPRTRGTPCYASTFTAGQFASCYISRTAGYRDGVQLTTSGSQGDWYCANRVQIGSSYMEQGTGSYTNNPKICRVMFFNRERTADEIAANYAIDKARFGLP